MDEKSAEIESKVARAETERDEVNVLTLDSILHHPRMREPETSIRRVEAVLEKSRAELAEARVNLERLEADAARAIADGRESPKGLERARERVVLYQRELRVAERALELAREDQAKVLVQVRAEVHATLTKTYAEAIRELDQVLETAAERNRRIFEIWEKGSQLFGSGLKGQWRLERAWWHELMRPDPTTDSRLENWREWISKNIRA